jgi:nitrate/TMAO reductase-like tetraheme cytochrome c subunit
MRLKLPSSTQNWISLIGATIAVISLFMIVFLFVITGILEEQGSYLGLIVYILLPSFLILGLLLIPLGMLITHRKLRKDREKIADEWPKIDLNDIRHRNAFFIFFIGTTLFLFLSGIGSYEAFHFTESVTFCGEICHSVMEPEYTAYQNSPHARVACVDCHVGTGVDWYMRSKLSGLYQVYSVLANVYPKPIPTPIKNLRPARETCEKCHWPQKFYAQKLRNERHYLNDEENTEWDIHLVMKIGAQYSALGLQEGIHWHINPDVKIEYVATDDKNLEIPWVRHTNLKTGESTVYLDKENPVEEDKLNAAKINTMDCMDCHNRPSHSYRPPAFFINEAITAGEIPVKLPGIKALAMEICARDFPSSDSARISITAAINDFYAKNHEEIYKNDRALVDKAAEGIYQAFSRNIFPFMKVKWDAYPNHIGHLEFEGCFRCHNDRHVSEEGQVISRNCEICHNIIAQGTPAEKMTANLGESLEFVHPADVGEDWKEVLCTECHTGLNP